MTDICHREVEFLAERTAFVEQKWLFLPRVVEVRPHQCELLFAQIFPVDEIPRRVHVLLVEACFDKSVVELERIRAERRRHGPIADVEAEAVDDYDVVLLERRSDVLFRIVVYERPSEEEARPPQQ